ncbi:MAG: HlyD family type I secretion periplasmic adaptor subunit [Burkholderiales bacterium]|nr:HlyD family type I secretion periplasmic adaptor subunit [Burkholderiales bacterium]
MLKSGAGVEPRDFAAPLLRVQATPPPPFAGWLLKGLLVFFGGLLAWAALGRLDIVAVASGKLVPQNYLRIVQPLEQGIVKEILVREGEEVRQGQVLMRMDPALTEADRRVVGNELRLKRLQLRRIDAEMAGAAIAKLPGDDESLLSQVEAQHRTRRQAYQDAVDVEKATLLKARQDLKAAQEVEAKLQKTVPMYKDIADGWAKLAQEGFAGKLLAQERARLYVESAQDLKAQNENVESLRATIAQAEKKLAQITSNYRQQLQNDRIETAAQAQRLEEELAKHDYRTEQMELKAPQAGIVKDLATHTAGTVAAPGTILMTIVPRGEPLVAEVWVSNDDVGFIRRGQPVKVKLSTFQFQKYGMVEGSVRQVSADASENQNSGGAALETGRNRTSLPLTYKTIVEMKTQDLLAQGVQYALVPGMQVAAEIHLGTRTVLEYLLSPVSKAFHEAGRER